MRRDTPYKGLVPYDEQDAEFFFGRDSQRDIIIANLMASRLTLVYGPSGVGKSSVLRAGVEHRLKKISKRDVEKRGAPEFAFVVFNSWRDNPVEALEAQINDQISKVAPAKSSTSQKSQKKLFTKSLAAWSERIGGDIYVVLDQFEEYFLYHPNEQGENCFAVQFPKAVNQADLRVNFLISIREDSLAKLDFFKGRIPRLFDNYLRIDHLDDKAARQAIEGPIRKYNELYRLHDAPITIDPLLTDAVLEQVAAGRLSLGETGLGVVESKTAAKLIETPYLQLVMTRLWNEELSSGSTELRLATLKRLGNAKTIVRTHLDETMFSLSPEDQETAASAFHYLVTPSGTKIAHKARDLAKYSGIPQSEIEPVLEKLSTGKILILRKVVTITDTESAPRYEIFHDVLATAILDWRSRFTLNRQFLREATSTVQEKALRNRLKLLAAILALLAAAALAVYAYSQAQEVKRLRSLVFVKHANQQLGTPCGVLLAQAAFKVKPIDEAEAALRKALWMYPGLQTFHHPGGIQTADLSPDGRYVVTGGKNGAVGLWNARTGQLINSFPASSGAFDVAFSHTGRDILVTALSELSIWDPTTGTKKRAVTIPGLLRGKLSFDDNNIVTYSVALEGAFPRPYSIQVLDSKSGEVKATLIRKYVSDARFSPAGDAVLVVSEGVEVWKWGATPATTTKVIGPTVAGQLSPDGTKVAESGSRRVRLFELATGRTQELTADIEGFPNLVAFSRDGSLLAASGSTEVVIWEVPTGKRLGTYNKHAAAITALALSDDGSRVLTGSDDLSAKVTYVRDPRQSFTFPKHQFAVEVLRFSENGDFVLTATAGDKARLWRAANHGSNTWEDTAPISALLTTLEQRLGGRTPDDEVDCYLASTTPASN